MKDSVHLTLHLTLLPTPCGIKVLRPWAASLRLLAKLCHRLSLFTSLLPSPLLFLLLLLTLSLIHPLPEGLVLLITSLQQTNRRKKKGQCETSVRFISVSSDPDTARDWHRLACVSPCVCVCVWTNRWRTAIHGMSCCFAYTHTYGFGCLCVCVCVWH